jgi:GNAT superfamily N-acetyltransferase
MDTARTFVLCHEEVVVGYVSLTMGSVRREEAPSSLVRGLPGHPVGMVLLARLAVDRREQGRGLGRRLLAEALRLAVRAGEAVAARLVVVDAIDEEAAASYRRNGVVAVPEHPARLFRRMKDVRASLDAADQH